MKRPLTERMVFRQYGPPRILTERAAHSDGRPITEITGVFQNFKDVNCNGRVYPRRIWERVLSESSEFMQKVKRRGVLGVLEHPESGETNISEASHVITDVRFATDQQILESKGVLREGDILGTYEILGTHSGKDLQALHESRCEVGVSSRGNGTTVPRGSYEEVNEDYDVDTWDVVSNPSVSRATPSPVSESGPNGTQGSPTPAGTLAESTPSSSQIPGRTSEQHTKPPHMSKLLEFKNLKARSLQLINTKSKGLKPTDLAVLVESAENIQLEGQILAGFHADGSRPRQQRPRPKVPHRNGRRVRRRAPRR